MSAGMGIGLHRSVMTSLFWIGAAVLLGCASPRSTAPVRHAEVLADRDGVRPGERLSLAVRITLNDEFHVNSHDPSREYLIPTRIETDPAAELEFGEWIYPEGRTRRFPFSEEPLKVYEGTFLIRGAVTVAPGAAEGPRRLVLRLRYQSCTREKCLAPKVEEIPLDLRVLGPGSAVRRLHPDLFPRPTP
jgi:hypothetical protein